MSDEQKARLHAEIIGLQQKLTGNMMEDLELRDKIHTLQMQLNNVTPNCSIDEGCITCSG